MTANQHDLARSLAPIASRGRADNCARRKPDGAPARAFAPLSAERIAAHVAGVETVGVYLMQPGSRTTRLALLDFDSHRGETPWGEMVATVARVVDALEARGLHSIVWRSSGGHGVHAWMVWDDPQDAHSVRAVLGQALAACGLRDGTGGVAAGQAEVFPKQDEVPPGGCGSMVWLPLARASEPVDMLLGQPAGREAAVGLTWPVSEPVPTVQRPDRATTVVTEPPDPIKKVRSALAAIPNDGAAGDLDYDAWFRVVCAAHEATAASDEGLEAVIAWSAQNPRHDGGATVRKVWRHSKSPGGRDRAVTRASLYAVARDRGWTWAGEIDDEGFESVPTEVNHHALAAVATDDIVDVLAQRATQDSVALAFRHSFAGRMKFAASRKRWYAWDGRRWQVDPTDLAFDFARACARRSNRDGKAAIASAAFASGVEQFARADRAFAVRGDEFDRDNYHLNTPAGTLDLSTGAWGQHNPDDAITRLTNVDPISTGGATFERFLREITLDDPSLAEFLQVAFGACLSGAIEGHWLLFLSGRGRNGKNTLGELITYAVGEYARKIPSHVLMAKQHEGHPTEIAQLQGVRIAFASEVNDGSHWHESRINELTGDETLSARFMGGDFFEFRRTFKLVIYGNHQPQLRTVTDALRSRIKIVPFRASFVGREDATLPARLREEAGYVLHWLIEGHAKWLAAGRKLPVCAAVDEASREYFASQSTVELWIEERVERLHDDRRKVLDLPRASSLYSDYSRWKRDRGEMPIGMVRFSDALSVLFERVKSSGVRYRGCRLRSWAPFDDGNSDLT